MRKIGRNSLCPCGSGLKYKKCCGKNKASKLEGLTAGVRMKGGVCLNPHGNGYVAVVHTWNNIFCNGEPKEWFSPEVFPTEDDAMEYYKTYIRPSLSQMMSEIQKSKSGIRSIHKKLE